ncbi:MAG: electron transporter RnfE [Faecalibacterium sp.]|jgi:electron transport complex protein RnfE|nr:electron transporter RnfE [Faecalibacterium sp.]
MRAEHAQMIVEDMEHYIHHDRIFLNNPAVMQGMGLAPLVIIATTGRYAGMLIVALAMLLIPTRVISSVLFQKLEQPLLRAMGYCGVAAAVYVLARMAMNSMFGTDTLELGVYLPLLVVDPLVIYRHGRVPESTYNAFSKGLRIMVGYSLVLLLVGCLREVLAMGTLFGHTVGKVLAFPLLNQPAGGFILVGVLFAVWRGACSWYIKYVKEEAKRGV